MQAIYTKFIPATNFRPSRIKATCERGSITVCYSDLNGKHEGDNFAAVARMLCDKFVAEDVAKYGKYGKESRPMWAKPFVTGGLPQGGYAHVFII